MQLPSVKSATLPPHMADTLQPQALQVTVPLVPTTCCTVKTEEGQGTSPDWTTHAWYGAMRFGVHWSPLHPAAIELSGAHSVSLPVYERLPVAWPALVQAPPDAPGPTNFRSSAE